MADVTSDALEQELLSLGMEDFIPVWEAIDAWEIREALGDGDRFPAVSEALVALAEADAIRVYTGHWDSSENELHVVSAAEAAALLRDPRFYDATTEPDERRVWFINVGNLVDP